MNGCPIWHNMLSIPQLNNQQLALVNMTNLVSTKELQNKMLEMLLAFDKFCKEYNLRYYLCGGCLIGAIRHKGFIPWDDDIDVFMPRSDYERLAMLWPQNAYSRKYRYCRTDKEHIYHDAGASIRDINTTEINRHSVNEDICHGIALEIMPIDGCPKSIIRRAIQLYNAFIFNLYNTQRLPDNKGRIIRCVAGVLYKCIKSPEKRYRLWKRAEQRMSKYRWDECEEVTELIGSIKGMLLRHPKKDFEQIIYMTFEGHQIPVMAGYDRYLRLIWGDYMKLPPEEKRVAKHDVVYLSTTEPYEKFQGIYYFVNDTN